VSERAIPLLGDVSLDYVQRIEHALDGGFVATRIAGLGGELQQRVARPSHRIAIAGVLVGDSATDALAALQQQAADGAELSFAADITSALELQKVVITGFRAAQEAGFSDRIHYELELAESPPLPPPASLEPFGGLGDFGLGDLGFDTDLLGELGELADQVAGAVDAAMAAVETLGALAALADLGDLSLGDVMAPIGDATAKLPSVGDDIADAAATLSALFNS
jgi:hypothetical protein